MGVWLDWSSQRRISRISDSHGINVSWKILKNFTFHNSYSFLILTSFKYYNLGIIFLGNIFPFILSDWWDKKSRMKDCQQQLVQNYVKGLWWKKGISEHFCFVSTDSIKQIRVLNQSWAFRGWDNLYIAADKLTFQHPAACSQWSVGIGGAKSNFLRISWENFRMYYRGRESVIYCFSSKKYQIDFWCSCKWSEWVHILTHMYFNSAYTVHSYEY